MPPNELRAEPGCRDARSASYTSTYPNTQSAFILAAVVRYVVPPVMEKNLHLVTPILNPGISPSSEDRGRAEQEDDQAEQCCNLMAGGGVSDWATHVPKTSKYDGGGTGGGKDRTLAKWGVSDWDADAQSTSRYAAGGETGGAWTGLDNSQGGNE